MPIVISMPIHQTAPHTNFIFKKRYKLKQDTKNHGFMAWQLKTVTLLGEGVGRVTQIPSMLGFGLRTLGLCQSQCGQLPP